MKMRGGISRHGLGYSIDLRWSQAHAVALADLDGDGQPELIAGKRYRAHGDGDPGGKDPCRLRFWSTGRSKRNGFKSARRAIGHDDDAKLNVADGRQPMVDTSLLAA